MSAAVAGPVCFRIGEQERELLSVLATSKGQTVSNMVREWVMEMARAQVAEEGGLDQVIEGARRQDREAAQRKERDRTERLAGMKL